MDDRDQIKDFLASRRAEITPQRAGSPTYGTNQRVTGLRRDALAMLASWAATDHLAAVAAP